MSMLLKMKSFSRVPATFCYQKKESTLAIPPASVCINRAIIRMHDTMVAHFGDIFEKTSTFGSFDRVTFTAQNL
ncbi:hypothetical protein Plhal304r1_c040g0117731 [Plasmopara halstedii]